MRSKGGCRQYWRENTIHCGVDGNMTTIDGRLKYIFDRIAQAFLLDETEVVDTLRERDELKLVSEFFSQHGSPRLLFLWRNDALELHVDDVPVLKGGRCMYFVRVGSKNITKANIDQECISGVIEEDLLLDMQKTLESVLLPALKVNEDWGELSKDDGTVDSGEIFDFITMIQNTVGSIEGAQESLTQGIHLRKVPTTYYDFPRTTAGFRETSRKMEVVMVLEDFAADWIKQIRCSIREMDEIREEDEDTGPHVELQYWKLRMASFSTVVEQVRSDDVLSVLNVLRMARSPRMDEWVLLDREITDAVNEAKDNVKYLSSMDKFCEPLYKSDPVQMVSYVPGLLNAIQIMHRISHYYNTTEKLTSLFVKITNQMIRCCKNFILAEKNSLFDEDIPVLLERLEACVRLNECYQTYFRDLRHHFRQASNDSVLELNEAAVFGKFDHFCGRLSKVMEVFSIIHHFSSLEESVVEGIEPIVNRFSSSMASFREKSIAYFLDYRDNAFENDFLVFMDSIMALERELVDFLNNSFDRITRCDRALNVLHQFEKIFPEGNLAKLLEQKYLQVFSNYAKELDVVRRVYEKYKESPPIQRLCAPISGRIMWARNLIRKVEEPMAHFKRSEVVMQSLESRRVVKLYNKLVATLLKFESMWFDAWCRSLETAKQGLRATLLVRHPKTGNLYVNFDPQIAQLLQEVSLLERLGFQIPPLARSIRSQRRKLKNLRETVTHLIHRIDRSIQEVDTEYEALAAPLIKSLKKKVGPGITHLAWTSPNIEAYLVSVGKALDNFDEMVAKLNDILQSRIMNNVNSIQEDIRFVRFSPNDDPFRSTEAFFEVQKVFIGEAVAELKVKNEEIETACDDFVSVLTKHHESADRESMSAEIEKFTRKMEIKTYQAIIASIRSSVDLLRTTTGRTHDHIGTQVTPLFIVDVNLSVPDVVLTPSLIDIQDVVIKIARTVLMSLKELCWWNRDQYDEDSSSSMYQQAGSNRRIVKTYLQLTGAVEGLKKSVSDYVSNFLESSFLWKGSRNRDIANFLEESPTLSDFEEKLLYFRGSMSSVEVMKDRFTIGALMMDVVPIIGAIKEEAQAWVDAYGGSLNDKVKSDMEHLSEYMDQTTTKLNRKIRDLDDINQTMAILGELRELESEIERKLGPIEETYAVLSKYKVFVTQEEQDKVDAIRSSWVSLVSLAREKMDRMKRIAPKYRRELTINVNNFKEDVTGFLKNYEMHGPGIKGIKPRIAVDRLKTFQTQYEERESKMNSYQMGEELFGLPRTDYPELVKIGKELRLLSRLYDLYTDVIMTINGYEDILWSEIDIEAISGQISDFQTRCRNMPRALREWDAFHELKQTIDNFDETLPLLEGLVSPCMRDRHWDLVSDACGMKLAYTSPEFKLKSLFDANLHTHRDDIEDITSASSKEAEIEKKLEKVKYDWVETQLTLGSFRNRGELILKPSEMSDLLTMIEDTQLTLGSLQSNRYNAYFRKEIQNWVLKLSTVQEVLELWLQVQALWVYLEAVFSGGDIARQLPQEAKRFANIDKSWVKIMAGAADNPNVIKLCFGDEMLQNLLPHLLESLELCQKSLSGYLEAKRQVFPRFYFVSDSQLLEILGQGSDPHTIQPHLLSIFANIAHLDFGGEEDDVITHMHSAEGEKVQLYSLLRANDGIEVWLNSMVESMQESMRHICVKMVDDMNMIGSGDEEEIIRFFNKYPAQIVLLGIQLFWTLNGEDALTRGRTEKSVMQSTNKKFQLLLSLLIHMTTQDLSPVNRTKLETLITIHIHQVDIFASLVKMRIRIPTDFEWLKQTRFYWNVDDENAHASVTDVDFPYRWEYLGCKERLVITPLTDRIYISCGQAMGMYYGGAPAGPAGTGKTETTKDMGSSFGRYFITINCSDQMDYRGMGKLFKGIAQSGIWCGFDEINRVHLEVLSVVAAQIQSVFIAMRDRRDRFVFVDGTEMKLDHNAGIFITMNPGYAGRTELPENMKALFRTIAVVVPDREIIMRVRLAASGFQESSELSKKFFILYRLCEEQLSKQSHYDFGLRNILSVLRTCGSTKRENPDAAEISVLMRVLRDMNISKLVDEDEPLFLSLIADLFPGIQVEKKSYPDLQGAIERYAEEEGLVNTPSWNLKVVQFFEQWRVRHGLCVMGPSGSGKSLMIRTLARALSDISVRVTVMRMNPKAITATQMFGRLDVHTNDWTDGIFSALWRRACKRKEGNTWIQLDGPVDSIWIENLNTVLDDTKTLTLANGDRLVMPSSLRLIFEVGNLDNASPATVSRMGMVYMGSTALGYEPIVDAWMKRSRRAEHQDECMRLKGHFDSTVVSLTKFIEENCKPKMVMESVNIISAALKLLTGLLPRDLEDSPIKTTFEFIDRAFVFAMIWSFGGILESFDHYKIHKFLSSGKHDIPAVEGGETVFDYVISDTGEWERWSVRVPEWSYPSDHNPEFTSILVPTADSVRSEYLIHLISKQLLPVLLIGESGTAKTVTMLKYLDSLDSEVWKKKMLSFSYATTPTLFQKNMETSVEKRMGSTYGPAPGKKLMIFIDDISMPEINVWGDQDTNELVRQLIEDGGLYSLDRPGDWMNFLDVAFVSAMNHPSGGRNDIPDRLKRHFSIFNLSVPSKVSIERVFGTIVAGYFSSSRGFSSDVSEIALQLPSITRELWERTKEKMLPTPSKFHYIFNLRDLSRIFQGCLKADPEVISDGLLLLSLWKHECDRVIADKFTDEADWEYFGGTISEILVNVLGFEVVAQVMKPKIFVDFMRDPVEPDGEEEESYTPKIYEPFESAGDLDERLKEYMEQYNDAHRKNKMDLVLFEYAVTHLVRISRIICTTRGNALLVGVGGSGKQSLTRLAAFIASYKTFQIVLTKTYSVTNLLEDLKALYKTAALESPVVFLLTDNEIKDESFLEYVNMILTSGEVSGLFQGDELEMILEDLRPIAKEQHPGFIDTLENLQKFFIERVKNRLHVVLCFSPVGEKFRIRSRKFPGLISGCTIDWFFPWPVEALHATAERFLSDFGVVADERVKKSVVDHICNVHRIVNDLTSEYFSTHRRQVYVTPKSYLSFVNLYKSMYSKKSGELHQLAGRIRAGLDKLLQAEKDVSKMKHSLIQKEKDLVVAQADTDELLGEIKKETGIAQAKKNEVQNVKDVLQVEADRIEKEKNEAESELEAARPAIEAAEAALNQIRPADISTLKKLGKPPNLIKRIMDGVMILRNISPLEAVQIDPEFIHERKLIVASWDSAVKMMGDLNFLSALMEFDKDAISDETCELLQPYLEMEDFTTDQARKSSGNAAGLCTWVRAMSTYHEIAKAVAPKKARLREAEDQLNKAMSELNAAQAELDEKQRLVDMMMSKLDSAMKKKQALEDDARLTKSRLFAAERLIEGLAGEKSRWTRQSEEFEDTIRRLVGDVSLASAFLSYSGPFNQDYRNVLLSEQWPSDLDELKIPRSDHLALIRFLVDENTVGEWALQGLPSDELSVQNGIIVTTASRYPLLIDPQGQAKKWIKNKESQNGLIVVGLNDKMFRQYLEDSISQGRPLLIEDVEEEIDPVLDPLLEKQFTKTGRKLRVRIGEKEVDVESGFMLYITTKLPNPRFSPEVAAKTSLIDFTVTMKGLEDQLLGRVILMEKADLEQSRKQLLEEINTCKKTVSQCEEDLLVRLSGSEGNLLDDASLVDVLAQTKQIAQEVAEKLSNAETTEKQITLAREEFRPVATRGSVLYFVITELSVVNCMYQTSLDQFLRWFDASMEKSEKSPITAKRIASIIKNATFEIYKAVQRGLYEKDKTMYSLLLLLKIHLVAGIISQKEFSLLLKGGATVDMSSAPRKPFKWLPDGAWYNLLAVRELPSLMSIVESMARCENEWKAYYDKETPEDSDLPDGYEEKLTKFERLLVVRMLREDRAIAAATQYIMTTLGEQFVEGIPLNWEALLEETNVKTPVICLLSMGSDSTSSIEALAKKRKMRLTMVSMGQGQEAIARRLVSTAMASGGWVLLQNCHLGINYLPELEDQMNQLQVSECHESFRLFITTEPRDKFPIGLLQMSLKITNEQPQGLKAGLRRSYAWVTHDMFYAVDLMQWRKMLYVICFLHSTVIERKKFGPLGWCVPYEFNQTDLAASAQYLQNSLYNMDPKKGISWHTVQYMICEVQYGGRITDDFDKRLLNTYGHFWLSPEALTPEFEFYNGYNVPDFSTLEEFREHINQLPLIDTPEIFGMHTNAEITFNATKAADVLGTILDIQPKESTGSGKETREDVVLRMADEFLLKLPPDYSKSLVKAQLKRQGGPTPLNVFLGQEIDRIQLVISLVRRTLNDLKLAIGGTIIMSTALQDALDAMFNGRVPPNWMKLSWESPNLGYWFNDFVACVKQYTSWLNDGPPKSYWLTGFFNPQGFLTAVKQECTRANFKDGWSLDNVVLTTEVLRDQVDDIRSPAEGGVYIHGLYLEGAAWDTRGCRLIEAPPKILDWKMPVIKVSAVNSPQGRDLRLYTCPVYRLPRRTAQHYVFDVSLRTDSSPEKWALRGVALLLSRV